MFDAILVFALSLSHIVLHYCYEEYTIRFMLLFILSVLLFDDVVLINNYSIPLTQIIIITNP